MNNNIRHAVSKQTGATTYAFRADRAQWKVQCLSHGSETTVGNRGIAWTTSSHPALFCTKCKSIAAGKAKRIDAASDPDHPHRDQTEGHQDWKARYGNPEGCHQESILITRPDRPRRPSAGVASCQRKRSPAHPCNS